jgi:5-methylcytosine-specific restriction endonuclease McrA
MAKETWQDWKVYVDGKCECVYCGISGRNRLDIWQKLVIDHLVPRSAFPSEERERAEDAKNKVVACQTCNRTKGRYDPRVEGSPNTPEELIKRSWEIIQKRWRRLDLENDFKLMMDEIDTSEK